MSPRSSDIFINLHTSRKLRRCPTLLYDANIVENTIVYPIIKAAKTMKHKDWLLKNILHCWMSKTSSLL